MVGGEKYKMKTEMVPFEDVQEEIAQKEKATGGKWVDLIEAVSQSEDAAVITGLSKGQVAAASKACKDTDVRCRTFYKEGKVILYVPPE